MVTLTTLLALGGPGPGCYDPQLADCVVTCTASTQCAPDHVCGADGWCARAEVAGTCAGRRPGGGGVDARDQGAAPDAARQDAGAGVDAPAASCDPSCPGVCEDGVCVIACAGPGACRDEVRCPTRGPCRVECSGERSCRGGVRCGEGRCTVACDGGRSCDGAVACADACACEVTCAGRDACAHGARCPAPACVAGDGCVATPAGCDAC